MAQTLASCSFSPVALRRVSSHPGASSTSFCYLQPSRIHKGFSSPFKAGAPLALPLLSRSSQRTHGSRLAPASIRCEQSTKNSNGLDVWLSRLAMIGFATAVTVEITTGKGLLESFGVSAPLPVVALAVTGLVGVLTAFFIFQSASRK